MSGENKEMSPRRVESGSHINKANSPTLKMNIACESSPSNIYVC